MAKYLVKYTHATEITYEDWIEAESEEEAIRKADNGEVNFENEVEEQGLEIKDIEVLDEEEEDEE